jgi:enoyl-CoA hydratase/isomerase-like protein
MGMIEAEPIEREQRGPVTIVRMQSGENRFHPRLLNALEAVLRELEGSDEPAALVLTGSGKFFSNGLDLEYMSSNPDDAEPTLARVHALFGRVLGLEVPTIAAINGHAFAAGADARAGLRPGGDARGPRLLLSARSRPGAPVHCRDERADQRAADPARGARGDGSVAALRRIGGA